MGSETRFLTAPLIVGILLLSILPIGFVSANETPTTIDMFEGGFAAVEISLDGTSADNSTSILVPRNVTFISSSFEIEIESQNPSPGSVFIDVSGDGTNEWEFNETGFGNLGHQNVFYNGLEYAVVNSIANTVTSPGFFLPPDASLQSSNLNVTFSPDVGGGFFQIGEYQQAIESDIDGDGLPEPLFLLDESANNTTSFVYIDWSSSTGMTTSQSISTCDTASSISVGDVNGDGDQDVVAFSKSDNLACIHIANNSGFDPVLNVTISSGLIAAQLGDFDGDGSDDVIAIHSGGGVSYQPWDNVSFTLSSGLSETVMENGSFGNPANLAGLYVGDFFNNNSVGILTGDISGHWSLFLYVNNVIGGPITSFDNIKLNSLVYDLDGDGDLDLVGENDMGYAIAENNGTAWNTTTAMGQLGITNSSIGDFNGDGALEIMIPNPGTSDGSSNTIEGNITYRAINSTIVGSNSLQILEPWSIPTSIIMMDMDGDGVTEQIIAAGESSHGVFIGGWHEISLDADGDGTDEMTGFGYAGDSANGLDGLLMSDEFNGIMDDFNPVLLGSPKISYPYGIEMVNNSMFLESSGNGAFNLTDLDVGYDCAFMVKTNPSPTTNLTNVLNLGMTPGVGNYSVTISVNSTAAGIVKLTNLAAIHIPGAPNLVNPPVPVLVASYIGSDRVELQWTDPGITGAIPDNFELFRAETANGISITNPYQEPIINFAIDENIEVGATYYYQVRSIHEYGQTSNLSNLLEVTIPYPAPPAQIENVSISDVEEDSGGTVTVSWDESDASVNYYAIYLDNTQFDNVSSMSAVSIIGYGNNSTDISGLTDGLSYWAAVVGVDIYHNYTSEVVSVGPTYPRNDVPSTVELELSVSDLIQIGKPFELSISSTVNGNPSIPQGQITVTMVTEQGSHLVSTDWNGISVTDFSELGAYVDGLYGNTTFYANYSGYEGNLTNRPISQASTSLDAQIKIGAELSTSSQYYILDFENESDIRIDVNATTSSQSSLIEGATMTWMITNDSTLNSAMGNLTITNGFGQFLIDFAEGGTLTVSLSGPHWLNADDLVITIHPYGTLIEENNSNNQTNNGEWSPDSMELVTVDCGNVEITASSNQDIDCTFTNPNNFTLDISLEADGWSQWGTYILFEPKPGQSEFNLTAGESRIVSISSSLQEGFAESGLVSGNIEIDFWQGPSDYTTVGDLQRTVEILWTLKIEETNNQNQNNNQTNQTTTPTADNAEGSGDMLVYIGAVGAIAVIALVVIVVIRIRNSDIEDWSEDDLDFDQNLPSKEKASKPLPVGMALDEIEDRTVSEEAPERPDIISEFDSDEEEYEEEYEESYEEDESGISVDEHGTEWYEDEVGVWWYREEGQEDWSEFTE